MILVIIFSVIAYLVGSLSSAIIVCKLFKLPDPRTHGSMNPGATNVLRLGGKIPAILTLLGDVLKGSISVLLALLVGIHGFGLGIVAIAAFLGHLYPIFFKFQGGKGVATAFGTIIALSPIVGAAAAIIWLIMAYLFRYSSLAAITATITTPILMLISGNLGYLIPTLLICLVLLWTHRGNIARLQDGIESKISL